MIRQIQLGVIGVLMMVAVPSQAAEVVDRIVAIVNNEIITLIELNQATQSVRKQIDASDKSDAEKQEMRRSVERDILHKLIDRSLSNQEAEKYRIKVRDEDVDNAIQRFKAANNLDDENFKKALEAEGIPFEDYRERIREDILQSMLVNRAVRSKVIVTESDIKAYYDEHRDEFQGMKKYRLRNILMDTRDGIEAVRDQLAQKADFPSLAKQHSLASNAAEGGDLGVFDINNFSDVIREAVLPLEKGQFSDVIQTGAVYQIILVEDIIVEGGDSYEDARDHIHQILYRQQAEKKFNDWIESLKQNAHVKIML